MERTVVVGGGLAGLAAAAALAQRGRKVTLLESRSRLGGRAGSFVDGTTGEVIDNCQHVSMGCCTNLAHFCEAAGLQECFRRERTLNFIGPDGGIHRFSAGPLPAPLHLLRGLRRIGYLSAGDKWQLARAMQALAREDRSPNHRQTFAAWLQDHGQSPALVERFWRVVLVSALSESLDRIAVPAARKVFVDAFLAHRRGWEVLIPTVPLDELYGRRVRKWLQADGAIVRLQAGVERLHHNHQRIESVELRDGETIAADWFILAVPHDRVGQLLPPELREHPQLAGLTQLESAPISSVHLWFDREITSLPHAVLVERLSQWMFNQSVLRPNGGDSTREQTRSTSADEHGRRFAYQIVISASRNLTERTSAETIAEVVRELEGIWPEAKRAELLHSRLVTEHKAVCSPLPGAEEHRPPQHTPLENLQLAGDWTRTGWPSTMEGAVRSGYLAAENILAAAGEPERLVQPDLPVAFLSRVLLGL